MPPPNFVPPPAQRPPAEAPRAAKPKRLKAHTVTSKSYSIPMVPRDKKGKPMLPLNVGIMTVINLGDVCMREHFHTERYIFPVGYEVTRRYLSTVDQNVEVVYHCTILDGGDGPKFQIIPSDVPDRPVIAGTATGAWSNIVKQANAIRNRQHSNSVSGPDFFGLGQNTIKHLIQELPNADRLRDYVWQHFVEGGPLGGRHAAVIPALPEEYDAALPIGPYYPPRQQRDPSNQPESPKVSHYPPHILAQAAAAKRASPQQPFAPHPPQQQNYNDGGRPVLPPTPTSGGGSYYLPHTQQQSSSGSPGPGGGASRGVEYPAGDGPNGPSTFASIMNAFPTQEDGASNGGGSGGSGS
ncbi:F/Y rich C-terminus-domain-containing protein [Mycena sp. CBHHK59/15]|nr:F/Y rich C-terminus-domain-containing protein [Mycena sp. CBHHK59/15]